RPIGAAPCSTPVAGDVLDRDRRADRVRPLGLRPRRLLAQVDGAALLRRARRHGRRRTGGARAGEVSRQVQMSRAVIVRGPAAADRAPAQCVPPMAWTLKKNWPRIPGATVSVVVVVVAPIGEYVPPEDVASYTW